jgi:adenylate cyclase
MTEQTDARRLATILSIDIAGFSRASELDEVAAARHVQELRRIVGERAVAHHGRVFNTAGDGLMLEFPTVADGVAGALDIAEAAAEARKGGLPPIRLGLHVGDVTVLGNGDLIGAGVNVAARVQQRAEPGEILTTGDVRNLFATQSAAQFTRYGGAQLDKMARQVDLFALERPGFKARRTFVQRMRQNRWRMAQAGIAAAVAVALIVVAFIAFPPGKRLEEAAAGNRTPVVAVAPFENLSGDAGLNYFSAGMTEEIQHAVSRIRGIRVVTRAEGAEREARGTTHLLTGSVKKNGDRVRVSTQLARASGEILWSESFERPIAETVAVQDEIARKVAQALSVVAPESAKSASIDPRAFELYLRGREQWRTGGSQGGQVPQEAIVALEEAVQLAPKFSRAWVALASAYAQRQNWVVGDEQARTIQKARDAAARALELDPQIGEAYIVLGRFDPSNNVADRAVYFAKALAAEPNDPDVMLLHARFWLMEIGKTADAAAQLQKAFEADPNSQLLLSTYTSALSAIGDTERVEQLITELEGSNPTAGALWQMVMSEQLRRGDFAGARVSAAKFFEAVKKLTALISIERLEEMQGYVEDIVQALEKKDPAKVEAVIARTMGDLDKGQSAAAQAIFDLELMGRVDLVQEIVSNLYLKDGYKTDRADEIVAIPVTYPLGRVPASFLMNVFVKRLWTDPLFWSIMGKNGLAKYWLDSGQWPDFCAGIGGVAACKTQAEKALAAEKMN